MRDHHRTQRHARRPGGMTRPSTSPSTSPTSAARPDTSPARDRPRCAGRCMRPPRSPGAAAHPRPRVLPRGQGAARRQPRMPIGRAQAAQAQLPHAARARRGGVSTRMSFPVRAKPLVTPMRRGRLPAPSCRHARVDGPERPSGRNACTSGITPSHIMSPAPEPTRGSRTEVRLGARAHNSQRPANRAHAPPTRAAVQPQQPWTTRLTCGPCTSKERA